MYYMTYHYANDVIALLSELKSEKKCNLMKPHALYLPTSKAKIKFSIEIFLNRAATEETFQSEEKFKQKKILFLHYFSNFSHRCIRDLS